MKCSELIKILADTISTYGDINVQISVLTDNIDITQYLRDYDWGISEDGKNFILNFEIEDLKQFKKKLI